MSRALVVAAGATVLILAGVAGAISYSHMLELARLHGEVGWRVHAFPVSVDGIEVVASLVLLAHRRSGTPAGWLPWAALAAGTAASLAANVAVGASDPVGRLVAGWPAVALLVAIKLMSGLLETAGPHGPGASPPGPEPASLGPDASLPGPEPASLGPDASLPGPGAHSVDPGAGLDDPGSEAGDPATGPRGPGAGAHGPAAWRLDPGPFPNDPGANRGGPLPSSRAATAPDSGRPHGTDTAGPPRSTEVVPTELTAAARTIRDQLVAAGTPVTRRSLAAALRAAGHRVRNDRLGQLLAVADDVVEAGDRDG